MQNTKEHILQTALALFAANGYAAVSTSQIAGALGLTKGALYRHYPSKRAIFDAILARMAARDQQQAADCSVPVQPLPEAPDAYQTASPEALLAFGKSQFRYWTEDAFAASFRKILTIEQYRNAEMAGLYRQYLGEGPLQYTADLLSGIGIAHPLGQAAAFYGCMHLFYSVYDTAAEKSAVCAQLDAALEALHRTWKGETV